MDDLSATSAPIPLSSGTFQETPHEKPDLSTASTIETEPLASETLKLTEACKLAKTGETRRQFINRFLQLVHEVDFEFGFGNPADAFFRQALDTYGSFAREWISEIYLQHLNDPFVTCAILRVIAHFDYQQMYPQGMTIAAGAVANTDISVRECGVRCFESWENPESLNILRTFSFPDGWLKSYLMDVISDLERLDNRVISH